MSDPLPPLPRPWGCGLCGAPPAYTAEHMRDYARAAVEAALAAAPQAEPVAWAQKAALDGVREYGEIIATLYADGYQPEQEWTEPLYAAPPQRKPQAEPVRCVSVDTLSRMVESVDGLDCNARGYLWRKGWNDALRLAMDYAAPPQAAEPSDALREAAGNALEVLEALQAGCTDSDDGTVEAITVHCPEVIAALRDALEGER